jgi:hypothetical protein
MLLSGPAYLWDRKGGSAFCTRSKEGNRNYPQPQ